MAAPPRECPCFSGQRYAVCCGPLHRGEREAEAPAILMRSRFAAFSIGLGSYLVRTLASDHADLGLPHEELAHELSQARHQQRFLGLRIIHAAPPAGDEGEVLFFARIFEKGHDQSFVELSQFVREDKLWRYASGILVPRAELGESVDPETDPITPEELRQTFGLLTSARLLGSRGQ